MTVASYKHGKNPRYDKMSYAEGWLSAQLAKEGVEVSMMAVMAVAKELAK